MLWEHFPGAPRDVEALAQYVDQRLASLSLALDTFEIFAERYAIEWTHSDSTDPAIGNGVLRAHAARFGSLAFVQVRLAIGSTTTFEATPSPGRWRFSVPWAANGGLEEYVGAALFVDTGTLRYVGAAKIVEGNSYFIADIQSVVPFTWAQNDTLDVSLWYPVRD